MKAGLTLPLPWVKEALFYRGFVLDKVADHRRTRRAVTRWAVLWPRCKDPNHKLGLHATLKAAKEHVDLVVLMLHELDPDAFDENPEREIAAAMLRVHARKAATR